MAKPPAGVDDVFAATMVLLAGVSPSVVTTKAGKVKDRSWDASKKQLLGTNTRPEERVQACPNFSFGSIFDYHSDSVLRMAKKNAYFAICVGRIC